MSAPKLTYSSPQGGVAAHGDTREESEFSKRLKKEIEDATVNAVRVLLMLVLSFVVFVVFITTFYAKGLLEKAFLTSRQAEPGEVKAAAAVGLEGVATTDINLREGPGANTTKVGLYEKGSRVRIVGWGVNGKTQWFEVELLSQLRQEPDSRKRGWIAARYVTQLRP